MKERSFIILAACVALTSACESQSSNGSPPHDAGTEDDASADAMVPCPDGGCPVPGYASWPMPNEPESDVRPPSYRVDGEVVVDEVTGLIWQRDVDPETRATEDAIAYCDGLMLQGRDDWRLPERIELVSLMLPGSSPTIDSDAFPDTPADYFRTATYAADSDERSWSVYFGSALVIVGSATSTSTYARCVAGELETLDPQFALMDSIAIDNGTELVWRRDVQAASSQAEAMAACAAIDSDPFRLPTLKELLTIVDDTKTSPAIDEAIFAVGDSPMFWTSTTTDQIERLVDFTQGTTAEASPSDSYTVRCVR